MAVCGVLVIDKPAGLTSHDVVNRVRRKLGTRKVGHGGTLDPDVTGVLVLCVGDATRLLEYVSAERKTYEGTILFGVSTDTDDASGEVISVADASNLAAQDVNRVGRELVGWQTQVVPKYSAVHINGRRAYDLARAGIDVDLPSRKIHIEQLDVWNFTAGAEAMAAFRVVCSKGTYIRSLCRDWGERLGIPAHMNGLRRTASGHFAIDEAVTLETFEESEQPVCFLKSPLEALRGMEQYTISEATAIQLTHGQKVVLPMNRDPLPALISVVTEAQELVAVAEVSRLEPACSLLRPKKVFWKREQ